MAATLLWNTTYNSKTGKVTSTNPYYATPPTEAVNNPDVLEAKGFVEFDAVAPSFNEGTNVPITLEGATDCFYMLYGATSFNQPLSLPAATNCRAMLKATFSFNQPLELPNAIYCGDMLSSAKAFNQPLSLPNAIQCWEMLSGATSFNQPLSLPAATNCFNAFNNTAISAENANAIMASLQTFTDGSSHFVSFDYSPCCSDSAFDPSIATAKGWTVSAISGKISLSPASASVAEAGGAVSSKITTTGATGTLSATPSAEWITAEISGSTLGATVAANTGAARKGTIVVSGEFQTETATLTISQAAATTISLSPASASVAESGGAVSSTITTTGTTGTLSATPSATWITAEISGSTLTATVAENTGSARTGTVVVSGSETTETATLTISQAAATVSISLSPTSASVAESGGAVSSTITTTGATGALSATPSATWITAEISGSTLTATVAANTGAARTGTVVVSGAETTETATLTISQAGESIVEEVSISPTTASVVKAGGTVAATVSTNVEPSALTASADAEWISSVALTGTALSATVAANATGADRTGTITVATPAGATATLTVTQSGTRARSGLVVFASSAASRTVSVTQVEGADPTSASLAFVPAALDFPAAGGARVFAVANDRAGTLTLGAAPEWLTLTELSEGVYRAVAAKNAPTEARSGTITVSGSNGVSVAVPVSQAGGAGYSLSVSPQSFAFPYDGGSAILTVATDAPSWTPSVSGASTITIARLSSTQLSVNAAARTDGQESTQRAEILIAVTGASATVPVTQEGKPWSGNIPGGNGSAGGTDPDVPISPSRAFERRGASDYFIHRNTCTGGVNSDGGENWTTTLAMPRDKMQRFVASKSLFVGGTWQPVPIPSRNVPIIAGWTITESEPGTATIAIRYLLEAGASVSYQTDGKPAETRTESREGGTFERAFADCNALFAGTELAGSTQIIYERRAQVVEILRKFRAYWGTEEAIEELDEKVAEITNEKYKSAEAVAEAFPRVWGQVRQGLTGYLSYSPTFSITETLNSEPTIDRTGVYSDPPARILELPGTSEGIVAWLLMTDSCTAASNGQFNRTRMWQGAEIINPIYVKGA